VLARVAVDGLSVGVFVFGALDDFPTHRRQIVFAAETGYANKPIFPHIANSTAQQRSLVVSSHGEVWVKGKGSIAHE
jgi:hypothetical protein